MRLETPNGEYVCTGKVIAVRFIKKTLSYPYGSQWLATIDPHNSVEITPAEYERQKAILMGEGKE